jgi:Zn-dependent protease with chaperone function
LHRLGTGGSVLALRIGARALDEADAAHRRFRDIAEEVAVGAGVPVPALFVLDDPSINALAAGDRPAIAAVVLTRGALDRLDRAQLQGVVAHEISHVVGGDAALNLRLTSALYGLYSLRLAGQHLLDSALGRRPRSLLSLLTPIAAAAGAVLSALGMLGVLAAQLLRAGIGRQREFLADATAVQITRDRDGLGSALRRIASEQAIAGPTTAAGGAQRHCDYRALVSHFMLVQPACAGDWFDSHPPLAERIRRLYGRPMPPLRERTSAAAAFDERAPAASAAAPMVDRMVSWFRVPARMSGDDAADRGAGPRTEPMRWAETIAIDDDDRPAVPPLSATPASVLIGRLRAATVSREEASRWLCAIVAGAPAFDAEAESDPRVAAALRWLLSPAGVSLRVPVLELMLARLRRWSSAHRRELLERCRRAIEQDGRLESAEWIHYTLARHRLLPAGSGRRSRNAAPGRVAHSRALAALFAMAAAVGEVSARTTRDLLAETAALLAVPPPAATPDELDTIELAHALDTLESLPPLDKPILLRMLARMARAPGDADVAAFVRAVAAAIDCPVPRAAARHATARSDDPAAPS